MGYKGNTDELVYVGEGSGDFKEMKGALVDEKVQYVVFEVRAEGDELNPLKYVLMTWIGDGVPPGLQKARPSGHRRELLDLVKRELAIAAEFQPSSRSDITSEMIAQSIVRRRNEGATAGAHQSHDARAQLSETKEARVLSGLKLVDANNVVAGLKAARQAGHLNWSMSGYVPGKRDEVQYMKNGVGYDALRAELKDDGVYYIYFLLEHVESVQTTLKSLLISYCGPKVGGLQKARSGSHREVMFEFVLSNVAVQSQYQAESPDDINEKDFKTKLRID